MSTVPQAPWGVPDHSSAAAADGVGPGSPAVVVSGLVKRYHGVTAVDGIDLVARTGQVTAVLGPNGAGKTSTVECCEGLRRPDAGTVRILGEDPLRAGAAHRARVGVMLQDGGLPTGARAADVLRHVASLHARPLDPEDLIAALGLQDCRRTNVRRLSGGQKQRLAFAVAIVGRPEVVFLDEPTAGLDPQARQAVWAMVGRLRDEGAAVVLTTHLMDEAERLADQVVVLAGGRVVALGSPAELTAGVGDHLSFATSVPLDVAALQALLPVGITATETSPGHYAVTGSAAVPLDPHVVASVTTFCAARGVMPTGLSLGRRTLEDVFLDLTGRQLR